MPSNKESMDFQYKFDSLEAKINDFEKKIVLLEKKESIQNQQEVYEKNMISSLKKEKSDLAVMQTQFESLKTELKKDIQAQLENFFVKNDKKQKSNSLKETFFYWSERTDINCYNKIFEYENFFVKTFCFQINETKIVNAVFFLNFAFLILLSSAITDLVFFIFLFKDEK